MSAWANDLPESKEGRVRLAWRMLRPPRYPEHVLKITEIVNRPRARYNCNIMRQMTVEAPSIVGVLRRSTS
jgi:hypothetical protein